jgi:cell division protein FtsI (penicillin-binding protein 3)
MRTGRQRRTAVLVIMGLAAALLIGRAVDLQVLDNEFLLEQGRVRHLRVVPVPAHRGMITDRNGEPLAMSTPVDSVWADPSELSAQPSHVRELARLLGMDGEALATSLAERRGREFVYIKRHVDPQVAKQVRARGIAGVAMEREYRRYYPAGEVAGHVIGFTNVDDRGQEGLELAYDDWLRGSPGAKKVLRDGHRRVVADVEDIRPPRPGRSLRTSLDRRLQYLAYRELKAGVLAHRARSGSVVILDVSTGEVLAMVNQPAFNPNHRRSLKGSRYRNRAVTDVFEPGSTIKPFTVACALAYGGYRPDSPIDTSPGILRVGRNVVHDVHNLGRIDVATVIQKSSNVGATKLALALPREKLWSVFSALGFGKGTASGFPGEASGRLRGYREWYPIDQATLAFGYGLSVTPLQLARAYLVNAGDGLSRPISFVPVEGPVAGRRVLPSNVVRQVRRMLEAAVGEEGTAPQARVPGYRVAGKTGTVRRFQPEGYSRRQYVAVFAGMAPASRPRLVSVVVINEPSNGDYYGGKVAAPVFSRIMAESLRLLNVPPDDLPSLPARLASQGGAL